MLTGSIKEIPREGTLLPETYRFPRGTTRERVIQRMQQAQQRVVEGGLGPRSPDLPVRTPEQLVIAGLDRREGNRPAGRAHARRRRVRQSAEAEMKLQSDPTIIYGLVGGKGTLGRPIMRSEIEQPTPYNTYVIEGLPPGPIANPGRASLEAAAKPARTKELYFVADGTGGHTFSETYDQHRPRRRAAARDRGAGDARPRRRRTSRRRSRCRRDAALRQRLPRSRRPPPAGSDRRPRRRARAISRAAIRPDRASSSAAGVAA